MSPPIQQLESLAREVAALRCVIAKLLAQLEQSAIRRDFTISEWCRKRRISRAEFYRLRARPFTRSPPLLWSVRLSCGNMRVRCGRMRSCTGEADIDRGLCRPRSNNSIPCPRSGGAPMCDRETARTTRAVRHTPRFHDFRMVSEAAHLARGILQIARAWLGAACARDREAAPDYTRR